MRTQGGGIQLGYHKGKLAKPTGAWKGQQHVGLLHLDTIEQMLGGEGWSSNFHPQNGTLVVRLRKQ